MNDLLKSENTEDRKLGAIIFIKRNEWKNTKWKWNMVHSSKYQFHNIDSETNDKGSVLYYPSSSTIPLDEEVPVMRVCVNGALTLFKMKYCYVEEFSRDWGMALYPVTI